MQKDPQPGDRTSRKGVKKGEGLWLMSFSDMSLVLMSFFLLLLSTMKPAVDQFETVKEGLTAPGEAKPPAGSLKALREKIEALIKERRLEQSTAVRYDAEGLQIEFKDALLFPSGSAQLSTASASVSKDVLALIAGLDSPYRMVIEGHTDDTPLPASERFPSNWELSAARGFTLMRQFQKLGVPDERIAVLALAHTRPKIPYTDLKGQALQQARAANRRVVIRIE